MAALASLALLILLAPAAALAGEPRASLPDIEDEVMCTICGTTLQLSSSPQAEQERDLINGLIARGKTKEEIKDALVAEYGSEVLAVPSSSGFDLAAWLVPIVGILVALLAVGLAARRWRRRPRRLGPAAGAPGGGSDPADQARLDTDLGRYEL